MFIHFKVQGGVVLMMSLMLTSVCGNFPLYIAFHNIDYMWREVESRAVIGCYQSVTGSDWSAARGQKL